MIDLHVVTGRSYLITKKWHDGHIFCGSKGGEFGGWFTFVHFLFENWDNLSECLQLLPRSRFSTNSVTRTESTEMGLPGGAGKAGMDEGIHWQDRKGPHQDWEATRPRGVCLPCLLCFLLPLLLNLGAARFSLPHYVVQYDCPELPR